LLHLLCRQRHVPERLRPETGCDASPVRPAAGRDRQPVPRAAAAARSPERARERRAYGAPPGGGARRGRSHARGATRSESEGGARPAERAVTRSPVALGQHFLVDDNLLHVIGRLADLEAGDIVLEVGPGLGALTRFLAERVACVHAVEIDRALEPGLQAAL